MYTIHVYHSANAKGLKEIGTNTQINKSSESLNLERQGQRQSNQIKSQERIAGGQSRKERIEYSAFF